MAFGFEIMAESTEFSFGAVSFIVMKAFLFFVGGGYYFRGGLFLGFFSFGFLLDLVSFKVD